MDNIANIFNFAQGVLFDTTVGPFIVLLGAIYLSMTIKDLKQKKRLQHLQTQATIKGRQIIRGSGISIKLKSTDGWKTGVFLGANQDGFLIIKTENNSKIMVDPNYVSDIRIFDPN
ncbi:hypothetical protein [Natranaerobius thermophilus]|uniref:Uncharacterized protein n=1 Tax=Natranaerobius thermophilus (strain ATCC BAA-1301 / DSM 18059 / JW/NM-WN-LF) TaxID=457570 RepID=B2A8I3_NATTJ|nr:hypothetical protein [Natranaerobius thermophilus]ACB85867.1 hypothetical protein Nther_2301 [Natranaerobius thermophilus JW/NM-WN-LF]